MSIAPLRRALTPEDLLRLPDRNGYELVGGELVERKTSGRCSLIGGAILGRVGNYVSDRKLGIVLNASCGYRCFSDEPNRIRKPKASFIRSGRYTREQLLQDYMPIAPDLAIEVVSPNDTKYEVDEKVEEYLAAGVRLVWVLNPVMRTIDVHRLDGTVGKLHVQDELSGEDILPGFACRVEELFEVTV